jgi:alkanesulfonate monooxygenase SsuD/methylene tetrahydromethanopterin reductase-like flavin-dependent oxidoreductase (luciferase family)
MATDGARPAGLLYLGVELTGAGHHPAAWRAADAEADGLFDGQALLDQVRRAEAADLDFVIAADAFGLQPGGADVVRGRLDALLALARVAPVTSRIGLVAATDVTHTEPFHLSKNVATLDFVSAGRAGWQPTVSTTAAVAELFGRKPPAPEAELWAEADAAIDVVRRLWDSWEDDAIIRDAPTGRFLDRDKVHYVDFESPFFNVRGPSITPRSPQAQPLVVVAVDGEDALRVAAERADVVVVEAQGAAQARAQAEAVRRRVAVAGRRPDEVAVLVALGVLLGTSAAEARAERQRLDGLASARIPVPAVPDFTGSGAELAERLLAWAEGGDGADRGPDGYLLRPARLPHDLALVADEVVPRLQAEGRRSEFAPGTMLRARFGLARPANRYAPAR